MKNTVPVPKSVKAWAILDTETGELGRYSTGECEYMIAPAKTPRKRLHPTYECIPVIISFLKPKKVSKKKTV